MNRQVVSGLLSILLVPAVWGQTSTSTVSGTVRDETGAVIPGAAVVLTNSDTNVTQSTKTNEVGFYFYAGVIPGPYRLSVDVRGLQKFEGTFVAQVSQSVVVDPVLKPGSTTERVEVVDVTPLVTTDNPTVRNTLEHARLEQLPINGRNVTTLLSTLPGYEGGRVFGSPTDGQEWIVDGAVVSDRRWSGSPSTQPALDSIQEFTVEANAISAKLSRPVSIILSTKSGTNSLHGTAFETLRNNAIGLARSRTDFYTKPPQLIRNEYGISAGGPVYLPKIYNGKDRTFWFFGYEAQKSRSASTQGFNVPTQAMRDGDFSGLVDGQGRRYTLYDPWTTDSKTLARQPFAFGGRANVIDPSRQSPLAKYLFSIAPLPTTSANPLVDVNWFGPNPSRYNLWKVTNRIDHQFSTRDQVHLVLGASDWLNQYPTTAGGTGQQMLNGVAGWEYNSNNLKSASLTWTHVFAPTFTNEFLVSAKRNEWFGGENEGVDNWPDKLGLPNPFHTPRWPQTSNVGLGNFTFITNDTKKNYEAYYILDDNAIKVLGKHEFQFGVHIRRDRLNILPQQRFPAPQLNFATSATALYDTTSTPTSPVSAPFTGFNLANLYLGLATYSNNLSHSWYYLTGGEFAPYFQDNFKVSHRLTVNFGLRWEYWPAYHDKRGTNIGFSRDKHAVVLSTGIDQLYATGATYPSLVNTYKNLGINFIGYQEAGLPQDQVHARNDNFGPRLGFAYRGLNGKSSFVLRGGYSVSFFHINLAQWLDNTRQNYPLAASFSYNPNDATQSPDGIPSYMLRSVPTVVAGVNSRDVISLDRVSGINRGSGTLTYFAPDQPESRLHTWNLTIEKEVLSDTVVRARYVGTHGGNLGINYQYNDGTPSYIWYATMHQPLPTGTFANVATRFYDQTSLGGLREYRQAGWSNSHGMEFELERRYNKGYGFQLSYTMVNALIAGAQGASAPTVGELNQWLPGSVPADFDGRNRFLNYQRDTGIPKHRVKWNWLVDLPFGAGKHFGRNAGGVLDRFIGGWQLAGLGNWRTNYFSLPTGNWNITGVPVEIYGYKYRIENCTSGVCVPGYLWWNGYIPPNQINSRNAAGNPNGYMGIPDNYKPAVTPLIPWGSTAMPANAPAGTVVSQFWDTNTVWLPLQNGTTQRLSYDNGLNPWRNQSAPGIFQWGLDASLFKRIPITERTDLRFNADFFNVLNHPGNPNTIGGDGFLNTRGSGNGPRTLQLSLRLTW